MSEILFGSFHFDISIVYCLEGYFFPNTVL